MKRFINIVLLLAFCFWGFITKGQEKKWTAGPKMGLGQYNFVKDSKILGDWKTSFRAGGFFTYKPLKILSLNLDLLYSQTGIRNLDKSQIAEANYSTFQIEGAEDITIQQIEAPIYAGLHIPIFKHLETDILLGGSIGYNFYTEANLRKSHTTDDHTVRLTTERDVSNQYEYLNWAAISGLRFGMKRDETYYFIDLIYSYGLSNIDNLDKKLDQQLHGISINFGIGF